MTQPIQLTENGSSSLPPDYRRQVGRISDSVDVIRSEKIRQLAAEFQRQIVELNAKTMDTGLVVTLGDVLFESAKSELKRGAASNLAKLAVFLNKHENYIVVIEGYTDNQGSEAFNFGLSMRRANSVKNYLLNHGVESSRLAACGNGEGSPIASNASASGRQLNRRVEVIITNII